MAQYNKFAESLNGLFKNNYGDKLPNLIPDGVKLYKMIEFTPKSKSLGNLFVQAVILG